MRTQPFLASRESPPHPPSSRRRSVLLIGDGWFPDQAGGLNRYVREFQLAAATRLDVRSVVVGPAREPVAMTDVVGSREQPLAVRLARTTAAIRRRARDCDIIDCHFALYAATPIATGALRARPLVVHFHGPWEAESRVGGQRSRAHLSVKRRAERFVFRRARAFVVLSQAFKSLLTEEYRVDDERIVVIPPGVDLAAFAPADQSAAKTALDIPPDAWLAVAARRLVPRMGLDVLLSAWAKFCGETSADARLLIVGEGAERSRLEGEAARLDITANVRFCGALDDESLLRCYQAADVSVVPSLALEGFGLAALESLACGTPVIAADVGGLAELLSPLDPSLLVPTGSAEDLAARLAAAWSKARSLPGREACRAYAEKFAWDIALDRHVELYEQVLAEGNKTS